MPMLSCCNFPQLCFQINAAEFGRFGPLVEEPEHMQPLVPSARTRAHAAIGPLCSKPVRHRPSRNNLAQDIMVSLIGHQATMRKDYILILASDTAHCITPKQADGDQFCSGSRSYFEAATMTSCEPPCALTSFSRSDVTPRDASRTSAFVRLSGDVFPTTGWKMGLQRRHEELRIRASTTRSF
ncbi:hypothetical protein MUK42_36936 [Musa troglodytarum]|uniref:Uncharacterized protein n=1 Tax=Musa troglodytarum TaxID=320322 RepID=A0A9E7EBE4_9LILI|nr:hypothetical protein MUK42_36936 [Musa troglodytarum]